MSHIQYQTMCREVLNNSTWYKPIPPIKINGFINKFRELCTGAFWWGLIDRDTLNYLIPKHPRTPTFYTLPKTHKNLSRPPGRPIVSGIGSLNDNASKFVDSFFMPHVLSLPSYIHDTTDLLRHIEGIQVPWDSLLVAIDVESLYSSIPHENGVLMAESFLMEEERTSWPQMIFFYNYYLSYLHGTSSFLKINISYRPKAWPWARLVPHPTPIYSSEPGKESSFPTINIPPSYSLCFAGIDS